MANPSNAFDPNLFDGVADETVAPGGHLKVRLDVMSDHEVYLSASNSLGGIFVVTNTPLAKGAPLTLDVTLPWGETLSIEGQVAWVRRPSKTSLRVRTGMGVDFVELHDHQRMLLDRALLLRSPVPIPSDAESAFEM
jgi:Tfp pilus assembly protein PilZ